MSFRYQVSALLVVLALMHSAAYAQQAPPAQEVDAPTKKLMAAHGLFQRSLFKLAATEYTDFLAQYPQHAEANTARYALAVCHYRLTEHDKAIPLLEQVVADANFKQRDEALAVLGHCQLAANSYDKALAAFDELLAKYPQSKQAELAALNRAQVLYLAGKLPEAAAASDAFLKQFPQSSERPGAMYFLALAQSGQKQTAEAAQTLTGLLKTYPDSKYKVDASLLLGQTLEAGGKLDEAAEQYRQMVAAAPASRKADALYSLAAVLYKIGKYDEAAQSFNTVVTDYAASKYAAPARLQMGLAQLAGGKLPEARATLTAASADATQDPAYALKAKYGLAQCDIAEKKFDAARATLDQLAATQPPPPELPQILLDRALCLIETQKFEPAVAELEALRTQHPDAPQVAEAGYRQAFALHKLTKYAESHALCEKIAAMPASDMTAAAAELDAENLFLLEKYDDAAKAFTALAAAAKDEEHKLRFQLRLGQTAYFAGNYPKAIEILQPLAANPKVAATPELQPAVFLLGDAQLQKGDFKPAAETLTKFIAMTQADKREAQFKLALAQLRAEDLAAAEATFAQLVAAPADSPWVLRGKFEYGQLLYKQKKPDPAAASLNQVVADLAATEELAAPATYLLGWIDFDAAKYPDAAAKWASVVTKYPKHALVADATFYQGLALKQATQFQPALAALQAYITAYPQGEHLTKAKQAAAACLTALNKSDEAAQMLAGLAADPKGGDTVLYDLAWAQRTMKNNAAASETYRRILKEHPQSKLVSAVKTELAEFLYADKKYQEAAELLQGVVADSGADPKTVAAALYRLGWCYEKLQQPEKSAAAFATFAEKNPEDPLSGSAMLQAGLAQAAQGKFDAAAKQFTAMLAKFPQHEQAGVALLKLGEAQAAMNSFDASMATFTQFLQRFPTDPFAYRAKFGLGWAQENRKEYDAARKSYGEVIAANNTETAARAQFQIGETFLAEGKFEQAVPALLAVEDVYAYPQWSARALLEAGRAFEQLKQVSEAKQQYAQVVEKYKGAPEAAAAKQRLDLLK